MGRDKRIYRQEDLKQTKSIVHNFGKADAVTPRKETNDSTAVLAGLPGQATAM